MAKPSRQRLPGHRDRAPPPSPPARGPPMNASHPTRRARRGSLVRPAVWVSAAAMLATAAFAPATASAAPTSMDVACNNIVHGGRSPEYVWTTVDDAGVTANWATDAAHFDAANDSTVTVRVCVVDADGADHGG